MSIIPYSEFQAKYRFEGQISQGTFGRVCKIKEISTKKTFALKKLSIKKVQQLKDAQNQIKILRNFKHPFVVEIIEYYNFQIRQTYNQPAQEFGLVMELASESVQQLIRSERNLGSPDDILKKIFGLVQVLAIFQRQNIAHRDIKPANILIFNISETDSIWKLADFGLAINLNQSSQIQNIAGSFDYVSPILRRKFKFRNLKIKTNPFKDDVYSLGVTLLEIFTGFRKYTEQAYQKLQKACNNQSIVRLINIMLSQQQSLRPCFIQLLQIMKDDFSYLLDLSIKLKKYKISETTDKSFGQFSGKQNYADHNINRSGTKTICKKDIKNPEVSIFKLINKQIQCITSLDGKIICGCRGGQMIIVNDWKLNQIVEIRQGAIHQKYVSQFTEDSNGNIWSVGGDQNIIKWKKFSFLKALMSNVKQEDSYQTKMFKTKNSSTRNVIDNNQRISKRMKIPYSHATGSSSIFAIDQNRYAVGFNDGYILIVWNWKELHCRVHSQPIINIKISNDGSTLFTCSTDGCVKSIDLKSLSLNNRFFYSKQIITSIGVFDEEPNQSICVKTLSGQIFYLNMNLQQIFRNQIHIKSDNLLSSVTQYGKSYSLTETGEFIGMNDEQILNLFEITNGIRGWNCINLISPEQIIVGSFEGALALIEF